MKYPLDKPHPFNTNSVDVLAFVFLAFTRKKPNESSSEGRTDEASIKKETKEARKKREICDGTGFIAFAFSLRALEPYETWLCF